MTLFWMPEGPMMKYEHATLKIFDLNPKAEIRWRFTRWEIFRLGLKCLWASVW